MKGFTYLLLVGSLFLVGCRAKQVPPPPSQDHIAALARAYTQYTAKHGNKGPANEGELREYLKKLSPEQARSIGIDSTNLDSHFVSPRDGKPYTVVYGFNPKEKPPSGDPVFVYEQVGENNKRFVGFFGAKVKELDAGEFDKVVPK